MYAHTSAAYPGTALSGGRAIRMAVSLGRCGLRTAFAWKLGVGLFWSMFVTYLKPTYVWSTIGLRHHPVVEWCPRNADLFDGKETSWISMEVGRFRFSFSF